MAKSKTVQRSNMQQTVGGKVTREAAKESASTGRFYWWRGWADKDDQTLANEIGSTVKFIQDHQANRIDQLTVSTRLYGQNSPYNMVGTAFSRSNAVQSNPQFSRLSYNLCASVIDTLVAQAAKNKIVPTFLTSGGVWGMQQRAEKLSKFASGAFYEQKMHEKKVYMFRDGCIWGDGILHVYRDDKDRAAVERVVPHELIVDMVESMVTDPCQLHRVKVVDRNVLVEQFPEHEEKIMQAMPPSPEDLGASATAADLITVIQSHHLSSGPEADDGVCVISLPDSGVVLDKYEWDKDYFPYVFFQYSKRPFGFWGQGACERLQNLQGELNRTMVTISKAHWLMAGAKIYLPNGSKVATQHLNNEIGAIINGDQPPQYLMPPMVQAEMYSWADALITKGYQQEGVSQMQAASVKPAGINSGTALRTYDEIAEDRQLFLGQQMEQAELEVIRQMVEVVRDVFKSKGKYEVNYPHANFLETIDWSDVSLDRDEYFLKAFPTSELPEEPAARLETIQEYMAAGLFSPRTGKRLMRTEDIEMQVDLDDAAENLIFKTIEEILYDGEKADKDRRPDAEWDLQAATQITLQYLNYAKLNNCPEKNINELRKFKAYIDDAIGLTAPPPPMAPPGPAGVVAPQANPAPTPQSPIVQNTNTGVQ